MAQSVAYTCGFETGGFQEIVTAAGASIVTSPVASGNYALKVAGSSCVWDSVASLYSATQFACRFKLRIPALPGADTNIWQERIVSTAARTRLKINSANKLQFIDSAATLGSLVNVTGTTVLPINQWILIDLVMDLAGGGVMKLWIDGVLEINGTHSSNVSAAPSVNGAVQGAASPNEYFFDDIRVDIGGLTRIGAGLNILRQGTVGTPTYNAWTKTGGFGTAASCWSETPFGATNNCNSSTSGAAQTMPISPFSATQTGHGSEVLGSTDTINACKVVVVGKVGSATTLSIRRRVNSVDTDVSKTLTTADVAYNGGYFTTTYAFLNAMEAGVVKAANTTLTTVEDVWVTVDYTPDLTQNLSMTSIAPTATFGSPTLSLTIYITSLVSALTIGSPQITPGAVTIQAGGIGSTISIGPPTVTTGAVTISPDSITSGTTLGSPTITVGATTVSPDSLTSALTFGSPTVTTGAVSVSLSGIASTLAIGSPTITVGATTVSPDSIISTAALGSPTITTGVVEVEPDGVASTLSIGSPTVTAGSVTISPSSIVSTLVIGDVDVSQASGDQDVAPDSISSTATLGSPTLTTVVSVQMTGLASTAAVGSPVITPGAVTVSPTSIGTTVTFGSPKVSLNVSPASIDSTASVGSPVVTTSVLVQPASIAPTSSVGPITVTPGAAHITPDSIPSGSTVGSPTLSLTIYPDGLAPAGGVGPVTVTPGTVHVLLDSIEPTLTFGQPTITIEAHIIVTVFWLY